MPATVRARFPTAPPLSPAITVGTTGKAVSPQRVQNFDAEVIGNVKLDCVCGRGRQPGGRLLCLPGLG